MIQMRPLGGKRSRQEAGVRSPMSPERVVRAILAPMKDSLSRGYVEPYEDLLAGVRQKSVPSDDGTRIAYATVGRGPETIVLANGLGGRLYAWLPIIQAFRHRYRFITWDYRGLFDSASPETIKRMSVPDHAADLRALLDAEGVHAAHLCGWSMGVQVSLEFALTHPDRVRSLVLINGTYGHALSTAFQPLLRLPLSPVALHTVLESFIGAPRATDAVATLARAQTQALFWLRKRVTRKRSTFTLGLRQYVDDVTRTDHRNYLHLFQQIDAHSVYHLLPEVTAPTLVISGGLDPLTPSYQSRHIARRIPGARHVSIKLGSHFVVLERPRVVVDAMRAHLHTVDG